MQHHRAAGHPRRSCKVVTIPGECEFLQTLVVPSAGLNPDGIDVLKERCVVDVQCFEQANQPVTLVAAAIDEHAAPRALQLS